MSFSAFFSTYFSVNAETSRRAPLERGGWSYPLEIFTLETVESLHAGYGR